MAESRTLNVKSDGNGIRFIFFFKAQKDDQKTVNAVCKTAVLCGQQFYPVKSPVKYAVAVYNEQLHFYNPSEKRLADAAGQESLQSTIILNCFNTQLNRIRAVIVSYLSSFVVNNIRFYVKIRSDFYFGM